MAKNAGQFPPPGVVPPALGDPVKLESLTRWQDLPETADDRNLVEQKKAAEEAKKRLEEEAKKKETTGDQKKGYAETPQSGNGGVDAGAAAVPGAASAVEGGDGKDKEEGSREAAAAPTAAAAAPAAASTVAGQEEDPALALLGSVDLAAEKSKEEERERLHREAQQKNDDAAARSPFPCDEKLNRKLILCGDASLCSLAVDAVVNSTSEKMNDRTGISGRVFYYAGDGLLEEVRTVLTDGCPTGDSVITKGHALSAKHIIHTVGPRYSKRYETAAENALHACYRRSLELVKENGLASVAFCVVNTPRKGYPEEEAGHVALRTIRRFLETYGDGIDSVVLCTEKNPSDTALYRRLLPLYFPRSEGECTRVLPFLPQNLGNAMGETEIEERKIRVSAMPGLGQDYKFLPGVVPLEKPKAENKSMHVSDAEKPYFEADFTAPLEHPDARRQAAAAQMSKAEKKADAENRVYLSYLRQARETDLKQMRAANFIYQSGVDGLGRPIICFVAQNVPAKPTENLHLILLYIISVLDPIVSKDYNVIYFHHGVKSENKPPMAWMKKVYAIFNRKYKKNMKRLFVVHPSFWVRAVVWFATPFISKKFWVKLKYVNKLREIYDQFDPKLLQVPPSIREFDEKKFAGYYKMHGGGMEKKDDDENAAL